MSDRILIHDLMVRGIIGVNEDERVNAQDILINLTLDVDARAAGRSDDIQDISYTESSVHNLVEKLATEIARLCLACPGVTRVTVRVEKPGALRFTRSVGVEIERAQGDL
jgi:FolB domain-containing protein